MTRDVEMIAAAFRGLQPFGQKHGNEEHVPPGDRKCVVCGERMTTERTHGIAAEVCRAHGVWLDSGELSALLDRVRTGERLDRDTAVSAAKHDGKLSGIFLGVLSLLLD